ncbi:MAG: hypothetical protein V7763_01410 [Sulfitobacter sp.]|jgi:hypothetical protein|uniref:hypothetical protein n=1 Tax=Sulfitobacter sp. TaxID=1903071 RepID=UPI000C12100C|nr:hypothetical protein [Roseobacter sp.]MBV49242.1 hypothetical protein [Roseobacter sp.]PHR09776.1 MAG: hypothetical protein COB29_02670 [Sulfitobacter sp.]|tara:strand:+ start:5573 stop:5950 length:378 start_codon:yes stop_codon:yes gene_type:complete
MIDQLTDRVAIRAAQSARTAAIGIASFICLAVGGIFLASAAWLFLLTVTTAIVACLIIGGAFFGIGLMMFSLMLLRIRTQKRLRYEAALQARAAQSAQMAGGIGGLLGLITAFINGMNAGKKARF